MKILVVSDSHMMNDQLERLPLKYGDEVDLMIHCGDTSLPVDAPLLRPFDIVVKGNHDLDDFPKFVQYQNIMVTHGQYYNVYGGYDELIQLCKEKDCQLCLHGHTHVPTIQYHEGITFVNPGSIMINRGTYGYGTYALIEMENGKPVSIQHYHFETDEPCDESILQEGLELLEEFKDIVRKARR